MKLSRAVLAALLVLPADGSCTIDMPGAVDSDVSSLIVASVILFPSVARVVIATDPL